MCKGNHVPPLVCSIATPEIGTRLLVYGEQVGLSRDQLDQVLALARDWRRRYIEHAERISELGDALDAALLEHRVDLPQAREIAEQRRSIIARMEDGYIAVWDELFSLISEEQDDAIIDLYRDEFKILPHPTLGLRSAAPR